ncbi:MAG TPA: hypothetical protein VLE97_11245 [Gaiellaceae bacterium]|nr:hypothetical protein [Gaiellaceae bacterium]
MTKLIPAWLPVKNRRIEIDPSRLVYRRGYPSSLGPEHDHLQLSVWNAKEVAEAHLEAAIVSDTVDHLVVDVPGEKCHNEKLTAEYSYVTAEHKEHELHHVVYVWRLVRASDGKILYDSLDAHESRRTCGSSDSPLEWGEIVRRLRGAGELTHVPYRSFWSWP